MSSPSEYVLSVEDPDLDRLIAGQHHDPHHVLGGHLVQDADGHDHVVIRGVAPRRDRA